ncbi:MAG: energy transducer TonB [Deltaproteobacteria bacterium]|jgi:protein TonB|nr:energy transducer TonB [Deltaproteobacteria bacterium]
MNARETSNHVFNRALFLAIVFHLTIVLFLIAPKMDSSGYRVLAHMQFDTYDPLGGMPGGDQAEAPPEADPMMDNEPVVEEPEPEPEPEVVEDPPQLVESVSEKAEVRAPPPPPPKVPPKPKTQPKPKPKPAAQSAAPSDAASAGQVSPGTGAGGGPGTGQGGVGGGSGKGTADAYAAYKSKVQKKLVRYKKYPPAARNGKMEGTVTVKFTIARSGKVVSSQLIKTSGAPILDDEVMALLRRVDPFPEFPKEIQEATMTLTVPIRFTIKDR